MNVLTTDMNDLSICLSVYIDACVHGQRGKRDISYREKQRHPIVCGDFLSQLRVKFFTSLLFVFLSIIISFPCRYANEKERKN